MDPLCHGASITRIDGERAFSQPLRLWIFSDLHQEYWENRWDPTPPEQSYDAIIAAGDICGTAPEAIAWLRRKFPHDRIIFIAGNHDFWQRDPDKPRKTLWQILDEGREAAHRYEIDFLSDDAITIGATRILGCTLWTDYRIAGFGTAHAIRIAEKGLNDYRYIRRPSTTRPTKPIRGADILPLHRASLAFLDAELGTDFDGPSIIVTHHAPHARSLDRQHDELNVCYASDLTWLVERHQPALWIHGHIHSPSDYRIGGTQIICNPRGYATERQQRRWRSDLVIEI